MMIELLLVLRLYRPYNGRRVIAGALGDCCKTQNIVKIVLYK